MSALPLIPDLSPSKLVGIARLAAAAEPIREGHNVEYLTMEARTVLNRCVAKNMPFHWTVNPYRGCEFACKYCYARYTHDFMEIKDPLEFERRIFVKQHTAWLLRRDLKRVKAHEAIAIGTATDPFQPAEKRYEMTRGILEELARHSGLNIGIVTKSQLILRDLELLKQIDECSRLTINVTVTTPDIELARKLEPRAPRPDIRLQTVRALVDAGLNAGVICAPVLPGITDSTKDIDNMVGAAKAAGARFIFPNPLFLKSLSAAVFMPFLKEHFPALVKPYEQRYGKEAYVSPVYHKRVSAMFEAACAKHGMPRQAERRERRAALDAQAKPAQYSLF
jgi:DNA repair photolyase